MKQDKEVYSFFGNLDIDNQSPCFQNVDKQRTNLFYRGKNDSCEIWLSTESPQISKGIVLAIGKQHKEAQKQILKELKERSQKPFFLFSQSSPRQKIELPNIARPEANSIHPTLLSLQE